MADYNPDEGYETQVATPAPEPAATAYNPDEGYNVAPAPDGAASPPVRPVSAINPQMQQGTPQEAPPVNETQVYNPDEGYDVASFSESPSVSQPGSDDGGGYEPQRSNTSGPQTFIQDRWADVQGAADRLGSRVDTARREFEEGDYGQAALQAGGAALGLAGDVAGGALNALGGPQRAIQFSQGAGSEFLGIDSSGQNPAGFIGGTAATLAGITNPAIGMAALGQSPLVQETGKALFTGGPGAALDSLGQRAQKAYQAGQDYSPGRGVGLEGTARGLVDLGYMIGSDPLLPLAPGMLSKAGTAGKVADNAIFAPFNAAQKFGGPLGGTIFGVSLVTSGAMQTVNPDSAGLVSNLPVVGPMYTQLRNAVPAENRGALDFGSNLLVGIAAGLALSKARVPGFTTPVLATAAREANGKRGPVQEGDLVKRARTLDAPTKGSVVNEGARYLENFTDTMWQASDGNATRFQPAMANLVVAFRQGASPDALAKVAADNGINLPAESFAAHQNRAALGLIARSVEGFIGERLDSPNVPRMVIGGKGEAGGNAVPIMEPVNKARAFFDTLYKLNGEDPATTAQILASRAVQQLRADIGRTTPDWQNPVSRYFATVRQLSDLPKDNPVSQPGTELAMRMKRGLGEYLVPDSPAFRDVVAALSEDATPLQRAQMVTKLDQVLGDAERVSRQLGYNKGDGPVVPALNPKARAFNDNIMMRLATDSKILISPLWLTSRPQYWVNNALTNAVISAIGTQGRVFGAMGQRGIDGYEARRGVGTSERLPSWVNQGLRTDLAGEGNDTLFIGMARRAAAKNATLGAPGRAVGGIGSAIGDATKNFRQIFIESTWRKATYIAEHNRIYDENIPRLAAQQAKLYPNLVGTEVEGWIRALNIWAITGKAPKATDWFGTTDPNLIRPMERDLILRIAQQSPDAQSFKAAVQAHYEAVLAESRSAVGARPVSPEQGLVPVRPSTPPPTGAPVSESPVAPGSAASFRREFGIENTPPVATPPRRQTGTYRPENIPDAPERDLIGAPDPSQPIPLTTIRDLVADTRGTLYTVPADTNAGPYNAIAVQVQQAFSEAQAAKQAAVDHLRSGNRGPAWSNERSRLETAAKAADQKLRGLQTALQEIPAPRAYSDFELQSGAVADPIAREITVKVGGQDVQIGLTDTVAREYDRLGQAFKGATARKMQMELLGLNQTLKTGALVTDGTGRVGEVVRQNLRGTWRTEIVPVDRTATEVMGNYAGARLIPGEGVTILSDSPNFIRSRTDLVIDDLGYLPAGPKGANTPDPALQPRPMASGEPATPADINAIRADLRALGDVRVISVNGAEVFDIGGLARATGPYPTLAGPLNRIQGIPSSSGLDLGTLTKIRRNVAAMVSETSEFNGGRAFKGNEAVVRLLDQAVRDGDTVTIEKIRIWARVMNRITDEYAVVPLPYPERPALRGQGAKTTNPGSQGRGSSLPAVKSRKFEMPDWADEFTGVGGKIDADGTVLLYHATTADNAAGIARNGLLLRPTDAPDAYGVYASSSKGISSDYGDGTVVPIRVRVEDLQLDDAMAGRVDFLIETRRGAYKPVAVGDKALREVTAPVPPPPPRMIIDTKADRPYALVPRDSVPELQRILKEQGDQSYVAAIGETKGNTFRVSDDAPLPVARVDSPPVVADTPPVIETTPPPDPATIIENAGLTDQIPPTGKAQQSRMTDTNAAMLELKPLMDEITAARAQLEAAGIDLSVQARGWENPIGGGRNPNFSPDSTAALNRYNQALSAFDDAKARIRQKAESIGHPDPTTPTIGDDAARAILRQMTFKDGTPFDSVLDDINPADSYARYVGGVMRDVDSYAASAGPRPNRMPTMADLQAVKNGAGDIAQRQGLDNARGILFPYDNKNYGDYLMAHAMPYSYWILRHMAQSGRYLAQHPGQYAALMSVVNQWYKETEGLSPGQRWTVFAGTMPDGTEVRFRPAALLPFATGSILEVANPTNKASSDWFVELQHMTGFGASLLPQFEVGRQLAATKGINAGPLQGLFPSGAPENRARDILSQSRILRQVTQGAVDLEGGKLFGIQYPSFREAIYGTNQIGIENWYTGIELAAMVKRGEITDLDAKRALLSQKENKPNDLYTRAQQTALGEQGYWSSARFFGLPIGGLSPERQRLDGLNDQYGALVDAGVDSKTRSAFTKQSSDLAVSWAGNDDPRMLALSIANDEYRKSKEQVDARYAADFKRISDDLIAKRINGGSWLDQRNYLYDMRQKEYDALLAANPNADPDGKKREAIEATLPKGIEYPQSDAAKRQEAIEDRQRAVSDGYYGITTAKFTGPEGEIDFAGYKAARDQYLASLTPAERTTLLADTKKNQTDADKWYEANITPLAEKYGNIPKYAGNPSPETTKVWDTARNTYQQARYGDDGKDRGHAAGLAALSKAGISQATFSQAQTARNPARTAFYNSQEMAPYRAFYNGGTSAPTTSSTTRPQTNTSGRVSGGNASNASQSSFVRSGGTGTRTDWDKDPVTKGIDGQPFSVRQFWQEQDLLRQRGQLNDAAAQLNKNWEALKAAGINLTGNKPAYRGPEQQAAYEARTAIYEKIDKAAAKNYEDGARLRTQYRDELARLSSIVSGKPYNPSPFWPNTANAPRGSRGGSIRVPRAPLPPRTGTTPRPPAQDTSEFARLTREAGEPVVAALLRFTGGKGPMPSRDNLDRLRKKYPLGLPATASLEAWITLYSGLLNKQHAA